MQIPKASLLVDQKADIGVQSESAGPEPDAADASGGQPVIARDLDLIEEMLSSDAAPRRWSGAPDQPRADRPPAHDVRRIPLADLRPAGRRIRHPLKAADVESLADSIRRHGLLQPILVRPAPDEAGVYEIVCGERRWRAAQAAGLHNMPAIVRDFADGGVLVASLVENLERQELTALEEAEGYRRLIDESDLSQAELATLIGKSRSAVTNVLRLLEAPDEVKAALQAGQITAGHARALLGAPAPNRLLRRVIAKQLSVRETERLAGRSASGAGSRPVAVRDNDFDVDFLEQVVTTLLGLRTTMKRQGSKGTITLHYDDLAQLDAFLSRLHSLEQQTGDEPGAAPAAEA